MSSPLVTFIFKTFPKQRITQFWNFLPEIWKVCNQRQLVSIDFEKKIKKIKFLNFFFSKIFLTSCLRLQIFQICGKNFQNWVALFFGKVLKIKVTKGELIISNHVETADQYLLGGHRRTWNPKFGHTVDGVYVIRWFWD